jgi:hypothetical protein
VKRETLGVRREEGNKERCGSRLTTHE